jgi:hypothetical protein
MARELLVTNAMATRMAWVLAAIWTLGPAWGCDRSPEGPDPSDAWPSRGGGSPPAAAQATGGSATATATTTTTTTTTNAYPGHGFVLHEWGTNTVVSASDGALELGLHHEEEDLPAFVYDRLAVSSKDPNVAGVKMETPVAYFYSDTARRVSARVDFPSGILTQWYPGVVKLKPQIPGSGPGIDLNALADPAMDPSVMLGSQYCLDYYRAGGWLDWGSFDLLAPSAPPPATPEAPLDAFTWSYARNVAANYLAFSSGENERFLFYRGVSNVALPARTEVLPAGKVRVRNLRVEPLGPVFAVRVSDEGAAFVFSPRVVDGLQELELQAPELAALRPLPEYSSALGAKVTDVLEQSGLYHDEAVAMVSTWQRQWFLTPGVRLLYLAPAAWTDAVIPLTISPVPDTVVRTMMIRVELLTPEMEAEDVAALTLLESDPSRGRAHFAALGRFAEPRLRRALRQLPSSAGSSYLEELRYGVARAALSE